VVLCNHELSNGISIRLTVFDDNANNLLEKYIIINVTEPLSDISITDIPLPERVESFTQLQYSVAGQNLDAILINTYPDPLSEYSEDPSAISCDIDEHLKDNQGIETLLFSCFATLVEDQSFCIEFDAKLGYNKPSNVIESVVTSGQKIQIINIIYEPQDVVEFEEFPIYVEGNNIRNLGIVISKPQEVSCYKDSSNIFGANGYGEVVFACTSTLSFGESFNVSFENTANEQEIPDTFSVVMGGFDYSINITSIIAPAEVPEGGEPFSILIEGSNLERIVVINRDFNDGECTQGAVLSIGPNSRLDVECTANLSEGEVFVILIYPDDAEDETDYIEEVFVNIGPDDSPVIDIRSIQSPSTGIPSQGMDIQIGGFNVDGIKIINNESNPVSCEITDFEDRGVSRMDILDITCHPRNGEIYEDFAIEIENLSGYKAFYLPITIRMWPW